MTSSKAPDVLAGGTMRQTYPIKIVTVNRPTYTSECIWGAYLVANDPPTHLVILHTTSGVSEPFTASPNRSSPTHSKWGGDLLPHRGAKLGGVRHVEVGYTSPARLTTWLQDGYYCLAKQTTCSISDLIPQYLALFIRGTGLPTTALQDLGRVGEGESGVGSLCNSWLRQDNKVSYSYADKIDKSFHNSAVLAVECDELRTRKV